LLARFLGFGGTQASETNLQFSERGLPISMMTEGKRAGVSVQVRIPPKLLGRLDATIATTSAPKPTRGKVIKNLVRQALNARDNRRGTAKGASGRAWGFAG
jgi:hypothetical protein